MKHLFNIYAVEMVYTQSLDIFDVQEPVYDHFIQLYKRRV
jgi:hypothetical protein